MFTIAIIKTLNQQYDNGTVWCSIDEITTFLGELLLFVTILPVAILGDIFLMPLTILIFFIRKHNDEKYFNKKYTLKDFINEID